MGEGKGGRKSVIHATLFPLILSIRGSKRANTNHLMELQHIPGYNVNGRESNFDDV